MYEECLIVFNSMSYSNHALDAGRANFNANYTRLSELFHQWKSQMVIKYGNNDPNSEFSQKMNVFMDHLLFQYVEISPQQSPEQRDTLYENTSHAFFDENKSIYSNFNEMMLASPWMHLYESGNDMAEWKRDMIWMGKRLFCIAYYNNPDHLYQYKHVQNFLADENCEELWNVGAPIFAQVLSLKPRDIPFDDPHDTPFDPDNPQFQEPRLTGLLRGLRTFS